MFLTDESSYLSGSVRPSIRGLADRWCPEIVHLMERMWAQDHQERPTMSEIVDELEQLVQQYR